MYSRTHFSELLSLIPRYKFNQFVLKYSADKHNKGFNSWTHLVTMVFSQLSKANSLREIETSFNSVVNAHFHMGARSIKRSTLSEANQKRDFRVFADLANELMKNFRPSKQKELKEFLFLLDSSPIILQGRHFDWTNKTRNYNNGLKLHMLYDTHTTTPTYIDITASNINDINIGRELPIQPNATYVFDKGYTDYNWWFSIHKKQSFFVTRFKKNAATHIIEELPINKSDTQLVLADQKVIFKNKTPRGGKINQYTVPLRKITIRRDNKNTPLVIATNDFNKSAGEIASLYKKRWDIELFFKWIKQNLKIKRFIGTSLNAVKTQIYTAIITYLLSLKLQKLKENTLPFYLFLEKLSALLFVPVTLIKNDGHSQKKKDQLLIKQQLNFSW
ncbi:hypothetical protein ATO12_13160 [Aquimarina atlantica]|uniref:Transposase n=2 Tax=Aquimarina atlantica TaxID=1317122 RepID=A0A023BMI4_9FLAO|nr:hypothetical protein ATO12_13160 [Aquimarina atlantica]